MSQSFKLSGVLFFSFFTCSTTNVGFVTQLLSFLTMAHQHEDKRDSFRCSEQMGMRPNGTQGKFSRNSLSSDYFTEV